MTEANVFMDQGKRRCRECVYGRNRDYQRNRDRHYDPVAKAAHERKMAKQRARRKRAREAA